MAFQDIRNGDLQTVIYKISAAGNFIWGNDGIMLHDQNATFEAAPKIAVFDNDDATGSSKTLFFLHHTFSSCI